jgi:hypothetical protein
MNSVPANRKRRSALLALVHAVPSVAPGLAARCLKKSECFCFRQQSFASYEERELPLRFALDPALPAVPLGTAPAEGSDRRYLRVTARGRYDSRHRLLLDNQVRRGRAGYRVLTPLRMEGDPRVLLVDRGWVPLGASRDELPAVAVSTEPRRVRGALAPPPDPVCCRKLRRKGRPAGPG